MDSKGEQFLLRSLTARVILMCRIFPKFGGTRLALYYCVPVVRLERSWAPTGGEVIALVPVIYLVDWGASPVLGRDLRPLPSSSVFYSDLEVCVLWGFPRPWALRPLQGLRPWSHGLRSRVFQTLVTGVSYLVYWVDHSSLTGPPPSLQEAAPFRLRRLAPPVGVPWVLLLGGGE